MTLEQRLQENEQFIERLSRHWHIGGTDKEDLAQEFRIILMDCHTKFDDSRGASFQTFLFSCCRNFVYKELKKMKRMPLTVPLQEDSELFAHVDDTGLIYELIEQLPMGDLTRRLLEGETLDEVVKNTELSRSKLWRQHRENVDFLKEYFSLMK